jgi:hypothetical protein
MAPYVPPTVTELGSLDELTQSKIYKSSGKGDVIILNGNEADPIPVPGGSVTSVS